MSSIAITGNAAGAGVFTIASPNSASSFTSTLPAATTTLVGTDATQTLTNKTIQGGAITSGTAVASTSGTSIDFTGIPSWVKRITVMIAGVSTSGTSPVRLQIGGGSVETTGYQSTATVMGVANGTSTGGFDRYQTAAADITNGYYSLLLIGSNQWVCVAQYALSTASDPGWISGKKTTATTLDRVRLTTVNGTDTFDAGTVNILYEG